MRKLSLITFAVLLVAASGMAAERVCMLEIFENTGCGACRAGDGFMNHLADSYGNDLAIAVFHVHWPLSSDPFYVYCSGDYDARRSHYNVTGIPKYVVGGKVLSSFLSFH